MLKELIHVQFKCTNKLIINVSHNVNITKSTDWMKFVLLCMQKSHIMDVNELQINDS